MIENEFFRFELSDFQASLNDMRRSIHVGCGVIRYLHYGHVGLIASGQTIKGSNLRRGDRRRIGGVHADLIAQKNVFAFLGRHAPLTRSLDSLHWLPTV